MALSAPTDGMDHRTSLPEDLTITGKAEDLLKDWGNHFMSLRYALRSKNPALLRNGLLGITAFRDYLEEKCTQYNAQHPEDPIPSDDPAFDGVRSSVSRLEEIAAELHVYGHLPVIVNGTRTRIEELVTESLDLIFAEHMTLGTTNESTVSIPSGGEHTVRINQDYGNYSFYPVVEYLDNPDCVTPDEVRQTLWEVSTYTRYCFDRLNRMIDDATALEREAAPDLLAAVEHPTPSVHLLDDLAHELRDLSAIPSDKLMLPPVQRHIRNLIGRADKILRPARAQGAA